MADNVLVDNGDEADYTVSSDEAASGQVQRTKLAYSANGSDTHVQADADGLLVNLGANNDVTVTGTVTASGPLTDAQLRATPVPVDVSDTSFSSTVADGADAALGATTDASSANTVIGRLKNLLSRWPAALGQTNKAGSLSVTLASDQDALAVTNAGLTELAAAINANELDINIASDSVGIGGGTQYTEGATDATITGTAILWEDAADTLKTVSGSDPLPVEIIAGAGSGGTASDDDADFTAGTTAGTPAMGVFESSPTSVTDGDLGIVGITASREVKVSAAALPLPSGAATSAKQDTIIGHVDGVETLLGTIDADTSTLAGAVAGSEMQVDIVSGSVGVSGTVTVDSELTTADLDTGAGTDTRAVVGLVGSKSGGGALIPGDATAGLKVDLGADNDVTVTSGTVTIGTALPAGANAIGKLAANSGVDIGDVDVTSVSGNVTVVQGTATNLKVDASGVAVPVTDNSGSLTVDAPVGTPVFVRLSDGSSAIATLPVSLASVPSHAVTNAGTFATQVDGAALTSLQLIDDPVIADDAAFTPATSKVMMAGFQADESSTDSVDEGDAGAARMTLDRKVYVTNQPHSAGGCSIYRSIDLDEGTLEVIKNSPGTLYGMWVTNTATTTRFVKFYDATSGTAGTGTPVITIGIPGNSSDDVSGAFGPAGVGIKFATGICFGAVTGVADNDTGAPGTNDVIANVFYL